MIRKYPIGLQNFRKIREGGYLYIDKTELIHRLVNSGVYYFLSRPRRFGKSLLVDTIEELFSGSRELFEGLWIEDRWDWSRKHPVIHISFSDIGVNTLGMIPAIGKALAENAHRLGLSLSDTSYDQQFKELIEKAAEKGQVIILIDEYDKPIIDHLDDPEKADEHRGIMKNFYSILKGADGYIRLLLITGVSRFSKVSIFSDLNNLNDITLSTRFGAIAGITQEELERDFSIEIAELQQENPAILEDIKTWYNGYSWDNKTRVYNPFSLLNFILEPVFRTYWYATGSPTFLINILKDRKVSDVEGLRISEMALGNFDITDPNMGALLFQTGYLTIHGQLGNGQVFTLGYPNREVKVSLLEGLLNAYRDAKITDARALTLDLKDALEATDIPAVIRILNSLIGEIPYDYWKADTESIFTIITFLTFKLTGVDVHTEVHSSKGRCDVLVKTSESVCVLELKLDGTAREALDQILDTDYLRPYAADPRKKIALGISFSSEKRAVDEYLMEEV